MPTHMTSTSIRDIASLLLFVGFCAALAGCSASVRERHYFATYDSKAPEEPVNFFRVDVNAETALTNARYIAGFYDERAVDLFFNEIKGDGKGTLFRADLKNPGTDQVLKPLDPGENGTFVMVLSTNADEIVDAVGTFAENQLVGQSVMQIVNASRVRDGRSGSAAAAPTRATATAFADEVTALAQSAGNAKTRAVAEAAYLRLLQRLATAVGGSGASFGSFREALTWFQAMQNSSGAAP